MFTATKIADGLLGIVGFRQPYNPNYAILDEDNTTSLSGLFVNDNPYAKIEFLKDTQDYKDISYDEFNALLKDMQKSSSISICSQVFNEFDFIDRGLIYKNASNKIGVETLPNGFVGYKIEVSQAKNTAFSINRVILDFNGTGTFTLLLFNTGKKVALQSKVITIASDNQVEELNWVLDNTSTTYKGDYYIGYVSTGIAVSPFKREWNNANVMSSFKELCLEKIFVKNHTGNQLFNLDLIEGLSQDTGLNLDISIYDDYTDFILNNKMLFAKAISLEFTIRCLQMYVSSIRSNTNERKSQELYQKIMIEIEGTKGSDSLISVTGLREQAIGEISQLKQEVKKLKIGFTKSRQILTYTLQ
ncbi:hypothetical protein [Flavobacterium sp.]|uniref:hypothetical protein n=1 Tax=Flavobacterium sp. TaxID=239 RepID=UPI0038FC922D